MNNQKDKTGFSRRQFLVASGLAGIAGSGLGAALIPNALSAEKSTGQSAHVAPGELDDYYGFFSSGQSGEVRVYGIPSMRELKRIPVFNYFPATGWGVTNESRKIMYEGLTPEGKRRADKQGGVLRNGDTHHVHMSYTDGTYDGRYLFVNDKANSRVGRIRVDLMVCDKITQIPNVQAVHGLRLQKVPRTGYIFCNGEFRIPQPNNGQGLDEIEKYGTLFSALDGDSMEVKWQVLVSGNLDNTNADYIGKYAFSTCYNSEGGVTLGEMMRAERDHVVVFNIPLIEQAVREGRFKTIGDSKVPVVDGTDGTDLTLYIPIPKGPHGINTSPDGKYFVANGKLSPTVSVVEIAKLDDYFAGKLKGPRDVVVAEPELGLGPLHTTFDGRGNAYTTLFIDSQVVKWNLEDAVKLFKDGETNPIRQKIDVHYQPGHLNASMAETKEADGKWLISLSKFSKDRFLNVGPLKPECDQLIDISGDEMKLVHDGPSYSEPHDCIIVRRDILHPKRLYDPNDPMFDDVKAMAAKDGVKLAEESKIIRDGNQVRVYMFSAAPSFGLEQIRVKQGDQVTVIISNIDQIEDVTHGFTVTNYDIQMEISPQQTASVTFEADETGVFWYYCQWFCHALHMEMRGRLIVEAA